MLYSAGQGEQGCSVFCVIFENYQIIIMIAITTYMLYNENDR